MFTDPNDYLSNTTADVRLTGGGVALCPYAANISSQRGMMFNNHLSQQQVIKGCELPYVMSGFESKFGKYAKNPTRRTEDVSVIAIIPKYTASMGGDSIKSTPSYTVIVQNSNEANEHGEANEITYFELSRNTMLAKGYGYRNKWNMDAIQPLTRGSFLPKETVLSTSPAVEGSKYKLGTNLRTAYMSLPWVTEDAFVISESAAKKLETTTVDQVILEIRADQIPLNLYGADDEYKFMPDIGETIHEDGILCAIRTPSTESMAYDTVPQHLTQIQYLHDSVYYAPAGATIIDIDVEINANVRDHFNDEIIGQATKYYNNHIEYYEAIYRCYSELRKLHLPISNRFNQLVTRAMERIIASKRPIPEFGYNPDLTLMKKKKAVDYIYLKIMYSCTNTIKKGYKLTGRCGNKLNVPLHA